jgi:pimeloyl-ACP methyl ester carboxylesterase
MWGSEGDFSIAHVLEDTAAAVAFIRGPGGRTMRSSPDDIVLIGHSMGGWAALVTAAGDEGIRAVASLAGVNIGPYGRSLDDPEKFAADIKDNERAMLPLRGTSAAAVTTEVHDHAADWDLLRYASRLAQRQLLLVAGKWDVVTPPTEHHEPLVAALEHQPGARMKTMLLDADHGFTERRITLARVLVEWLSALPMAPARTRSGP